jgi:hypothetical protein
MRPALADPALNLSVVVWGNRLQPDKTANQSTPLQKKSARRMNHQKGK